MISSAAASTPRRASDGHGHQRLPGRAGPETWRPAPESQGAVERPAERAAHELARETSGTTCREAHRLRRTWSEIRHLISDADIFDEAPDAPLEIDRVHAAISFATSGGEPDASQPCGVRLGSPALRPGWPGSSRSAIPARWASAHRCAPPRGRPRSRADWPLSGAPRWRRVRGARPTTPWPA